MTPREKDLVMALMACERTLRRVLATDTAMVRALGPDITGAIETAVRARKAAEGGGEVESEP